MPPLGFRGVVAAQRQFLLLFDLSFTNVSGLIRARAAAKDFVTSRLGPSDLAGVATISVTGGARLLLGFTSDRRQLQRAVEGLGLLDPDRKADPLAITYDSGLAEPLPADGGGKSEAKDAILAAEVHSTQVAFTQGQLEDYRRKVGSVVASLSNLARALDAIQGRKQILYMSAGYSDTLMAGETGDAQRESSEAVVEGRLWEVQSDAHFGDSGARNQMEKMLKSFANADVVVHTIDVMGLGGGPDVSDIGRTTQASGQQSLNQIARDTGGRYIRNTNDLAGALGEVLAASDHYYVLGFESQGLKGPGKFHKLKVRVRGNREVASRSGWTEGGPDQTPLTRSLQAAEAIAKGISGGSIRLSALAVPYRSAEGKATLPVVLGIDGASLLDRGAGDSLALEIFGYAFAPDGTVTDLVTLAPTLQLAKVGAKLRQRGLQLQTAFSLPLGPHSLRFLVRDKEKGRRGFLSLDVVVPDFESGTPLVSSPLFMDDPLTGLVLQAPSRGTPVLSLPFHVETDDFSPRLTPTLANGRTDRLCVLFYGGGAEYPQGAQFEIKAQLLNGEGTAVRLGKLAVAKAVAESDGFRRFVLAVTPAGVPAGDYTFKVKLKDPSSGTLVEGAELVRVE